ncbi:hypothetical protein AGLY_006721 [Aphis glycines]|uniref:Uncharacterized protein n=1 Tax=Aphis glycines TaxID=307491 RepID=A0A6G0TT59_APHGL|nr:hypothetical protein AGLY_006721 [Aphis glycines]
MKTRQDYSGPMLVNKLMLDQDILIEIWLPYFWARREFGIRNITIGLTKLKRKFIFKWIKHQQICIQTLCVVMSLSGIRVITHQLFHIILMIHLTMTVKTTRNKKKSGQVGTTLLYIRRWGRPRTRLFEAKLMENLVLNFLTLDINTNNFMNFELQNNLQIFMILTNFCQYLNFKC